MIIQLSNLLNETIEESKVYEDDIIQIYDLIPNGIDWKPLLYFKVYTKDNSGDFSQISRISMLEAKYVDCEYENKKLTKEEIDHLINCLNKYREESDFDDNITIWQLIIKENNIYRRLSNKNIEEIPMNLNIPNYKTLEE